MNWFQFTLWITGAYTLYYLAVILSDLRGAARHGTGVVIKRTLRLEEAAAAQIILPDAHSGDGLKATSMTVTPEQVPLAARQPESVGAGGVIFKDIFPLARTETIHYTGKVAF